MMNDIMNYIVAFAEFFVSNIIYIDFKVRITFISDLFICTAKIITI